MRREGVRACFQGLAFTGWAFINSRILSRSIMMSVLSCLKRMARLLVTDASCWCHHRPYTLKENKLTCEVRKVSIYFYSHSDETIPSFKQGIISCKWF